MKYFLFVLLLLVVGCGNSKEDCDETISEYRNLYDQCNYENAILSAKIDELEAGVCSNE